MLNAWWISAVCILCLLERKVELFDPRAHANDCDVSFDGKFIVYLAEGASGQARTGLCRLPWLKTLVNAETFVSRREAGVTMAFLS